MKEPFYEQNWATCLRPTMAYIFKWKEAPCKYKVIMYWYMVQQLVPGSRILENTWMTHIFSTQKLIHGLEIIGPGKHWSFDIIWSFWNEIKASPISLCVGLGASSCNLASYAGALTSTTNQTPQTPGPLVQAPLVESLTTHLNTDSRNSTHPQHSSRFSSKAQVSQFQVTVGSYPTHCCPKLRH